MEFSKSELRKTQVGINNYRHNVRKGKLGVKNREKKLKELRELSSKWKKLLKETEEDAVWEITRG